MKISLNWLKEFVKIDISVDKLLEKLTSAGMEVESVETLGQDTVLDVEITTNRADCLNMAGFAREVAAGLNKPVKFPLAPKAPMPKRNCDITITAKEACRRYAGLIINS